MGYAWESYAPEPAQAAAVKAWSQLSASVASQIGRGGGSPTGPESLYIALLNRPRMPTRTTGP